MAILGSTSLTGCSSIPDFINTNSYMIFHQSVAPTSWTKSTEHDDATLRVVSGTAGSGGTTAFTSVFTTRTATGSVGGHTLATTEIPSHTHTYRRFNSPLIPKDFAPNPSRFWVFTSLINTGGTGGGTSHSHPFSGDSLDFDVQYVDLIIASKD